MKKLLLPSLLLIVFQLTAMEQVPQSQPAQSLENFVYSLNIMPEAFSVSPLELQQQYVALHVSRDKQLWYPTKIITLPNEQIKTAHFTKDSLHILCNTWNVPLQKNQLQKLDLISGNIDPIPIPINCKKFLAIWNANETKYALIAKHLDGLIDVSRGGSSEIHIVDFQTNCLVATLFEDKKIKNVEWGPDDRYIMNNLGEIWNIETREKRKNLQQKLKNILVAGNNQGTKVIVHQSETCPYRCETTLWDTKNWVLLKHLFLDNRWDYVNMGWNKDDTLIAIGDAFMDRDKYIIIIDSDTGERISKIEAPNHARFAWGNNTTIFIYYSCKIAIIDALSGKPMAIIYNVPAERLYCNHDETLFVTLYHKKSNGIATLWQRYTDFTPQQTFFYWLLHKWILLKKLNPAIGSIGQLLDDMVFYLPLDKSALLTVWESFPTKVRKAIWDYKINHFIKGEQTNQYCYSNETTRYNPYDNYSA
jgi:hypothetical protein